MGPGLLGEWNYSLYQILYSWKFCDKSFCTFSLFNCLIASIIRFLFWFSYKAWGSLLGRRLAERDILVACIDYRYWCWNTIRHVRPYICDLDMGTWSLVLSASLYLMADVFLQKLSSRDHKWYDKRCFWRNLIYMQ